MTKNNKSSSTEPSLALLIRGVGFIAMVIGVVLSLLSRFTNLEFSQDLLVYLVVGGLFTAGTAEALYRIKRDFKKEMATTSDAETSTSNTPQPSRPKVTKLKALWESLIVFFTLYVILLILIASVNMMLGLIDMASLQSIIAKLLVLITFLGLPLLFSLFVAYGRYKRFEIIQ